MKTGILQGSAKDRPNYDVAGTINAVVITEIIPADRAVRTGPQNRYISRKKGSCIMKQALLGIQELIGLIRT